MSFSKLPSVIFLWVVVVTPTLVDAEQFEPFESQAEHVFSLPDTLGRTRSLSDYTGKVVLVNFWASWCGPCIHELPELTRLKQDMAGRPIEIVAINVGESKNRVTHFIKTIRFELPVLLDTSSQVFKRWGVNILPTSFLIDAGGRVRYRALGNPGWDQQPTFDIIEDLLKQAEKKTVSLLPEKPSKKRPVKNNRPD